MSREEEIRKASWEAYKEQKNPKIWAWNGDNAKGFIVGAEWADRTMIEKACEVFCQVRCKGKTPRSTCTSLGTCKEHDEFRKLYKKI